MFHHRRNHRALPSRGYASGRIVTTGQIPLSDLCQMVIVSEILVQPTAKLAAGRIDGPPFRLAHRHADATVAENRCKPPDTLRIGPVERQTHHWIIRNQIHVCPAVRQEARQRLRIGGRSLMPRSKTYS